VVRYIGTSVIIICKAVFKSSADRAN